MNEVSLAEVVVAMLGEIVLHQALLEVNFIIAGQLPGEGVADLELLLAEANGLSESADEGSLLLVELEVFLGFRGFSKWLVDSGEVSLCHFDINLII